jgi:hypothetical protein
MPVVSKRARSSNPQLAGFTFRGNVAIFVAQLELIAVDCDSGGPRSDSPSPVGAIDVEHLGGTKPVEDLFAGSLVKLPPGFRRQGLGR